MKPITDYDVAILGGGQAGLCLTRQLLRKHPDLRIAVVEKRAFPVQETTHKVGESTVEIGAHYLAEELQLKKHLADSQLPKFGLRFFFKDADQPIDESTEIGGSHFFASPSFQVDRGRLENYLADTNVEMGATIFDDAQIKNVEIDSSDNGKADTSHKVTFLTNGETERTITARWLVDASGRASVIKKKLGLEEDLNHDINATWFRIGAAIQIDDWCADEQWRSLIGKVPRRWLSTNHLMGEGYWVWIIPLATGSTSIGIVADPRVHPLNEINSFEKSYAWLQQFEPECAAAIEPHLNNVQDFLAIKKISRGARKVFSTDRWALVGEAAAFLDPFYSPGSDFIAIGNDMTARLIEEDMAGKSIEHLAPSLQSVFLTLLQNNLMTYRDQYPLFGNPRIMALKFVWDYAIYWSFPALMYFNGRITDVGFIQSLAKGVEEIRDMNLKMQEFFRNWFLLDRETNASPAFVNHSQIKLMTRLNSELNEKLEGPELKARFERNVEMIRNLMYEISQRIQRIQPEIETTIPNETATESQLEDVFETLQI